ncbi:MAG: hypothetical protein HWE18_01070 [Gammaproteobacteria bacterium]|nr:hypothetical protein [Gammaproteobacteria bacterium]
MGAIARFSMQGPRQAALMAVLFAAIPLMYWVSAAVVALVILRQGLNQGFSILLAALLPGVIWYATQQDITVFVVVLGSAVMAAVLRVTASLPKAISISILAGFATIALLPELSPQWFGILQQGAEEYGKALESRMDLAVAKQFQPWILPMLLGGISAMLQLFAIAGLLLGRAWQAKLFNPGGFQQEFHRLRLPYWYVLFALAVFLFGASDPSWVSSMPVILMPLFIMGISLVHGVIAMGRLSSQWLMGFYISFLFFLPYMYALLILVALLDTLFNFRKRLNDTA